MGTMTMEWINYVQYVLLIALPALIEILVLLALHKGLQIHLILLIDVYALQLIIPMELYVNPALLNVLLVLFTLYVQLATIQQKELQFQELVYAIVSYILYQIQPNVHLAFIHVPPVFHTHFVLPVHHQLIVIYQLNNVNV